MQRKTWISIITAGLWSAQMAAGATNFTERFDSSEENWLASDSVTPLTWLSTGGPDGSGDAFVRATNINFQAASAGSTVIFARGHDSFGSSGGAFTGDWVAGDVKLFSFDVRHALGTPVVMAARIASAANFPGTFAATPSLVPPDEWVTITIPIHPDNAGFTSFGGGSFAGNFGNVGNIQLALLTPDALAGNPGSYTVDVDNVSIRGGGAAIPSEQETWSSPTFDRWMYPFNASTPLGSRALASTFGAIGTPDFDERDAQAYFAFVLTNEIPSGLGVSAYEVTSARFYATVDDPSFVYDATQDDWQTYLPTNAALYVEDDTPGRPLELFGAGYRNGFDAWSFGEDASFAFGPGTGKGVRNVYPLGYRDGVALDVSNNIDSLNSGTNGFDPVVFAIGQAPVAPGDPLPSPTTFTFEVNVDHEHIQTYLRESLNKGILPLMLTSLHPASFGGPTQYPVLDQKETLVGTPASLEIEYRIRPALSPQLSSETLALTWPSEDIPIWIERTTNLVNGAWIPLTGFLQESNGMVTFSIEEGELESWFIRIINP